MNQDILRVINKPISPPPEGPGRVFSGALTVRADRHILPLEFEARLIFLDRCLRALPLLIIVKIFPPEFGGDAVNKKVT